MLCTHCGVIQTGQQNTISNHDCVGNSREELSGTVHHYSGQINNNAQTKVPVLQMWLAEVSMHIAMSHCSLYH